MKHARNECRELVNGHKEDPNKHNCFVSVIFLRVLHLVWYVLDSLVESENITDKHAGGSGKVRAHRADVKVVFEPDSQNGPRGKAAHVCLYEIW